MERPFVWAIDEEGNPTKCYAKPENRGKGSCNHQFHSEPGESVDRFIDRVENAMNSSSAPEPEPDYISQEEIDSYADRIDEICGCRVTEENYQEVLSSLTVEQIDALDKLGFEAAPKFSLPVTKEENELNVISFADLPKYHIGKSLAMNNMFGAIGDVPITWYDHAIPHSGTTTIESNYDTGLSDEEYLAKMFGTRTNQVRKTVGVTKPGATARLAFYALSDFEVVDDCGGDHSKGILGCKYPRGCCKKCAEHDHMNLEGKENSWIGGFVSTNLSEQLTQSFLSAIHSKPTTRSEDKAERVNSIINGYKTSPIYEDMVNANTTEERRQICFEGLKKAYEEAGAEVDDYNLKILARKLTSYKIGDDGRLNYVKEGELCDLPSLRKIAAKDNLYLQSQLTSNYKNIAKTQVFVNTPNAVNDISI